ncbi:MAG: sterol desaturase family protein, partial [Pseudomonadales bacterium]
MAPEMIAVIALFSCFILAEMRLTGFLRKPNQKTGDGTVEIVSTATLSLLIQPMVLAGGLLLGAMLFPNSAGVLSDWHFVSVFALFLVFDDLTQYWWHRLSHT